MRKAQAATEFLSTYGIAILALLGVTAILVYFGYLNPAQYSTRSCDLGSQVRCQDYLLTTEELKLTLFNTFKSDITILDVASETHPLTACTLPSIPAGQQGEITCDTDIQEATNAELDLAVTYTGPGGAPHTIRGTLRSSVLTDDDPLAACPDADDDGHAATSCGGDDCDDTATIAYPGAPDYCAGGKDEDCDLDSSPTEPGCVSCDNDNDGNNAKACLGTDCRDDNRFIWFGNPNGFCDCRTTDNGISQGTIETADGIDNDCDGIIDEGTQPLETDCGNAIDDDSDGCLDTVDTDCGGIESCMTSSDEDCDGLVNCNDPDCTVSPGQKATCLFCEDTTLSGDETDIDCGAYCPGCPDGYHCTNGFDCASEACETEKCVSCFDGIQNNGELGVDCGGTCAKQTCPAGTPCTANNQCDSNLCCPNWLCADMVGRNPICIT